MSWISELAGKAENFLNNLDNSAAQALAKSQDSLDHTNRHSPTMNIIDKYRSNSIYRSGKSDSNKSFPLESSKSNESEWRLGSDGRGSSSGYRTNTDVGSEEALEIDTLETRGAGRGRVSGDIDHHDEREDETLETRERRERQAGEASAIENKCLRSEISSLSREMSQVLQRSHRADEDNKRLRGQLEKVSGQLRDCDRKLRECVSEKDDLMETMKVKDQKITVLQTEVQLVKSRGADNASSAGDANVLSDHRNKILMLEQELRLKTESLDKLELEKSHWQNSIEDSKLKLAQTVNKYEKMRVDDKRRIEMLNDQLNVAKQKTASIQKDLQEYKVKAANILQMKEKMIASLKGNDEGIDDKFSYGNSTEDVQQELSNWRHDCDMLREEVARCRLELEHKDFDLQELDHQMHTETESLRRNLDLLEEQLEREKQLREDIDTDYRQLTRENRHLQEKYMREKADFHDHLAAKDEEIARMRQMISTKQANQTDQVIELEARVRSLTDTLIQKQAALESNKADYHSLQIRLERTELELGNLQKSASGSGLNADRRGVGSIGGSSDFITINMRDPPVTKNIKTALNTVDKFSLRMGLLLRRYPPARLFFILYSVVLHLWMLFVFLTYQPETHSVNGNLPNVPKGN